MLKYLITGGSGFIGSNLVAALLSNNENVRILDNFSTGRRQNIEPFVDQIEIIEGDLRSYHIVQQAVEGVDYILHQGALPSVPRSVSDPITSNEVNVLGTLNLLQAARNAGVKRIVSASSSSVYGNSKDLPKQEGMLTNPLSPYAVSKLAAEQYSQSFHRLYGLETVALRYFNVFGPRQDPTSQYSAVIPKFITAILNQQPITIHGDGSTSRDFSYIENVINANLLACVAPKAAGSIVNIACGERYTLLDLVQNLHEITGIKPIVVHTESRPGDVPHSLADISEAGRLLGYEPSVSFRQGLEKTVEWYTRG